MIKVLWILFPLSLLGCPQPAVDPVNPGAGTGTCTEYCAHLTELKCKGADDTKKGGKCLAVCENYQSNPATKRDFSCSMMATTCASVDVCEK